MQKLQTEKANQRRTKNADELAKTIAKIIYDADRWGNFNLRKKNNKESYEKIAKFLNENKIPASRSGQWSRKQVARIFERIEKLNRK